jgi:16S rRNA (guanine527-N7)-methyltransferase
MNLTRLTGPVDVAEGLILDSIYPERFIPGGQGVLDLGTGAGFPGVPLRIARPDLSMTLVDARRKKVSFLQYVIRELGLSGVSARHVRAEDLAGKGLHFDTVITRAVSSLHQLIPLAMPLVRKGGGFIAMKGAGWADELDALRQGGGVRIGNEEYPAGRLAIRVETYRLPASGMERALVMVERPG